MTTALEMKLCRLADPERAAVPVEAQEVDPILELAGAHGVMAVVLRKLGECVPEPQRSALRAEVNERIGPMLHLRTIWAQVNGLVAGGLAAMVVKGPDLADAVYPARADRPFTDLDIVAEPAAYPALAELLAALGYRLHIKRAFDHTVSNQEQKWVHPDIPSVLVEVHGNLVHYAALRRRVSFGYAELQRCAAVSPQLMRFFTVVVHATLGHKLHQLKMLVDVLQTFRRLGATDIAALPAMSRELRLTLEAGLCLDLVAQLFDVPAAAELARRVDPTQRPYRRLITPHTALAFPHSRLAVARHHLFRAFQYLVPR